MGMFDPPDPRVDWGPLRGNQIKTTPSGPGGGPRPLTLDEALQARQREQQNVRAYHAAWAMEEERKRQAANRFAPSPRYQPSPEEIARQQKVRDLYLAIVRGNSQTPVAIPMDFAQRHCLFPEAVHALSDQEFAYERARLEGYKKKALDEYYSQNWGRETPGYQEREREHKQKSFDRFWQEICDSRLKFEHWGYSTPWEKNFLDQYCRIHSNPSVQGLLSPYYTARFANPWASAFPNCSGMISSLLKFVKSCREMNIQAQKYDDYWRPGVWGTVRRALLKRSDYGSPPYRWPTGLVFEPDLLDGFERFVTQYQEGAIVIFVLLMTLDDPHRWRPDLGKNSCENLIWGNLRHHINMLHLPTLVNREPLDVFLLLGRLDNLLPPYHTHSWFRSAVKKLEERGELMTSSILIDMRLLRALLVKSQDQRVRQRWWTNSEQLVRTYLMARACDIIEFGQRVADRTFPQPTLPSVARDQVADMVTFMVHLIQEERREWGEQNKREHLAKKEKEIQREIEASCRIRVRKQSSYLYLSSRVLNAQERLQVREACLREFPSLKNEQ